MTPVTDALFLFLHAFACIYLQVERMEEVCRYCYLRDPGKTWRSLESMSEAALSLNLAVHVVSLADLDYFSAVDSDWFVRHLDSKAPGMLECAMVEATLRVKSPVGRESRRMRCCLSLIAIYSHFPDLGVDPDRILLDNSPAAGSLGRTVASGHPSLIYFGHQWEIRCNSLGLARFVMVDLGVRYFDLAIMISLPVPGLVKVVVSGGL